MIQKGQKLKNIFKRNLFLYSSLALIVMILITSLYFVIKFKNNPRISTKNLTGHTARQENLQNQKHIYYTNEMFNYFVDYPETLKVNELGSGGGYINFVRFDETGAGNYKGFAVGVSEQKFDNEIARIKKTIIDDGGVLVEESTIDMLDGSKGRQLYFKPKATASGDEDRTVVVFSHGKYTYSISTIPYQINDVLNRFSFTDK